MRGYAKKVAVARMTPPTRARVKLNLAEACPCIDAGGVMAEAFPDVDTGGARAEVLPGDDAGCRQPTLSST